MPLTGAHMIITGRVQGVGYRDFTARLAREMDLAGTVRNLKDGSVLVEVDGVRTVVETFVNRLKQGPAGSRVEDVQVSWLPATGRYFRFSIEA
jgi:acylphosphatase